MYRTQNTDLSEVCRLRTAQNCHDRTALRQQRLMKMRGSDTMNEQFTHFYEKFGFDAKDVKVLKQFTVSTDPNQIVQLVKRIRLTSKQLSKDTTLTEPSEAEEKFYDLLVTHNCHKKLIQLLTQQLPSDLLSDVMYILTNISSSESHLTNALYYSNIIEVLKPYLYDQNVLENVLNILSNITVEGVQMRDAVFNTCAKDVLVTALKIQKPIVMEAVFNLILNFSRHTPKIELTLFKPYLDFIEQNCSKDSLSLVITTLQTYTE
ncbi:hypothetical protein EIN_268730, partial [Entamoeba invadens IP1]